MTEYEYLDFVTSSVELISGNGFNYISVFFAYVACAYLVGSRISRVQAAAITVAYTVYLGITVMTIVTALGRLIAVSGTYAPETVDRFVAMQVVGPSLLAFIWLASVVFMATENAKRSRDAAPPEDLP